MDGMPAKSGNNLLCVICCIGNLYLAVTWGEPFTYKSI